MFCFQYAATFRSHLSALQAHRTSTMAASTEESHPGKNIQFRIMVGSYEHNLMCLLVLIDPKGARDAMFQPIFHFEAHSLLIKAIDLAKRYLVTGSNDEHIHIYDLQKRKELGDLMGHQGTITSLRFSSEGSKDEHHDKLGRWLLLGSEDGKIIIWRTKDWEMFGTLKGHTDRITDLAIHPSGRVAISVAADQTVRLWNLMTAKKAAVLKIKGRDHLGQYGDFVRWSHDGAYFIVGLKNQIMIYNTAGAKIVKKIQFPRVLMCAEIINVDGNEWLAVGLGNGKIQFFDWQKQIVDALPEEVTMETVEPLFELVGHTNRIKAMTYFSDETDTQGLPYLISVSLDGRIVVWNVAAKTEVAVYDTGERLNCVVACLERVEKTSTMKKRLSTHVDTYALELEYESDGETQKLMVGKKKKNKKRKVTVTRE